MENLKYIVEDSILAELLGVQNFSNKESAILELVKNAFDANALKIKIFIDKTSIIIEDNGCGMDKEDISNHWMHIGKSSKGYEINDENGKKRIQAGSKGVGRFALARLGECIEITSKKHNSNCVKWSTDWNSCSLLEVNEEKSVGTTMIITGLRDKWTEKTTKNLADYLGRTYRDTVMDIELYFEGRSILVEHIFFNPQKGINYSSKISLKYFSEKKLLSCIIESDEFKEEAQTYCKLNINNYEKTVELGKEYADKQFEEEIINIEDALVELGDFTAELYFGIDRVLSGDEEKFLYKRKILTKRYNSGIILYRNSFSISSYEGKKDWLALGKRSRKSPAAASHPTGSWRVRENQISGFVSIDKKTNNQLKDLANRQGLDENNYYKLFVEIIHTGLKEFERYRQSLIRDINKKNKPENAVEPLVSTEIVKNPEKLKTMPPEGMVKFLTEIKGFLKDQQEYQKSIESTEKRYKYDVRILNVLATSGLKATSIAHEMKNDRNKIDGNYDFIVEALKKYDLWDTLNEPEYTKASHLNVPELLLKNHDASVKILRFMDVMLDEVEKRQFLSKEHIIKELLDKVKGNWEDDYSWVDIKLFVDETIRFALPEDIITVIFDNLILNSIQQNENRDNLTIAICIKSSGGLLYVDYKDNGVGLPDKYKDSPMIILEPHETSREKGHGLGMWIVNNTLDMSGGEVIDIIDNDGFGIQFTIGGRL